LQTWQGQDESELLTPADWAFTETRFKHCFRVIEDQDPAPIPLVDWLQLESNARSNKTPCLTGVAGEDEISYVIDSSMLDVVVEREQNWRALQELAGLVTPFTARVEQEAEQKVAADHQAELASLKEEYEGRIAQLEQSIKSDMAVQIKDQLLKLADYRVTRSGDADAGMPESSQSQGHDVESTES
jgi:pyruvate-ferredoxin/flavodoxin oxidoreductase